MKNVIIILALSSVLFSCNENNQSSQQAQIKKQTDIKPTYSTIYDFCDSLKTYDADGRRSLMESNARMFMARDNVSNPETYIFVFRQGALNGNLEEAKKGMDIARSSYLGLSSGSNTVFVPACVNYIQSTAYFN
tara:strand:- start:18 stop:419 length:402 start_codon:yes stop_codon:yes gene_type:complete